MNYVPEPRGNFINNHTFCQTQQVQFTRQNINIDRKKQFSEVY